MDLADAIETLSDMVAAGEDPTLGFREIGQLLDLARRVDRAGNPPANDDTVAAWAAGTYAAGALVTAAGRYWRCLVPGTTASSAPSWPDLTDLGGPTGYRVGDNDVTWVDNGTTWSPTWDLNAAAAEGWTRKAGKAAGRFDFMTGDQRFMRSQVVAACERRARTYRSRVIGSALISR